MSDLLSITSGWPLWVVAIVVVVDLALRVVAVVVVSTNRHPSSAVAWLLAIFLIPFAGIAAFLLIGSPKLPRRRREKQRLVNELVLERTAGTRTAPASHQVPWLVPVARMNRRLGAFPLVEGNAARLLSDYDAALAAMATAVDEARPFFDALARAVSRGVVVRVLFDHHATRGYPGHAQTLAFLEDAGVAWRRMLPVCVSPRLQWRLGTDASTVAGTLMPATLA